MADANRISEAVTIAIRHIGIGYSSSGKIYAYLQQKGYDSSVCRSAVDELIEREYIDDIRAGRKIIRERVGRKQESRNLMAQRLASAGVASDKISILLEELDDDRATCKKLFDAYYPDIPDCDDPYSLIKEFMSVASRRGYGAESASAAFKMWLEDH